MPETAKNNSNGAKMQPRYKWMERNFCMCLIGRLWAELSRRNSLRDFLAVVGPVDLSVTRVQGSGAAIRADLGVFETGHMTIRKSQVASVVVAGGKLFHPAM